MCFNRTICIFTSLQIIELGLRGVFELIRETVSQHKSLCCKALRALLNMLQGQKLEGMKNEPHLILGNRNALRVVTAWYKMNTLS